MKNNDFTHEMALELFYYVPETGSLFWKKRAIKFFSDGKKTAEQAMNTWNAQNAGNAVAYYLSDGYKRTKVKTNNFKGGFLLHRLAWFIFYGYWPDVIDHDNRDRSDNRISNLKNSTVQENNKNKEKSLFNESGYTGVIKRNVKGEWNGKWRPFINVNGKTIFLGDRDTLEEALLARREAEIKYGYHENHGK